MKYGSLTNYILDQTFGERDHSDLDDEQVQKTIADFRFWLDVELYVPLISWLPVMTNTGEFTLTVCRIATEADGHTSLVNQNMIISVE